MMTDLLLAIGHHLAVFGLVAVVAMEWILVRDPPDHATVRRLARLNPGYLVLALTVLAVGLLRAFHGAKGWTFLAKNPVFHGKTMLFVVVCLVSVLPIMRFGQWRRAVAAPGWTVPLDQWRVVRRCLAVEFHLLLIIPILAVLMARGIGLPHS